MQHIYWTSCYYHEKSHLNAYKSITKGQTIYWKNGQLFERTSYQAPVELWGYAPRCLVGYKWLQSTSRATCHFSLIFEMCLHVFLVLNPREIFTFCTCIFCIRIRFTEPLFITTKNEGKSTCLSIDSYQVGKINHILFTLWHIGEQFK